MFLYTPVRRIGRADDWPETCICGERHRLVFTTRNGRPIEPRNINRTFDLRCARYRIRRISIHDTRRTCGSLLAALDVYPRVAMAIRSVRDLGLVSPGCPGGSGSCEGCSSVWLPAWLPPARLAGTASDLALG